MQRRSFWTQERPTAHSHRDGGKEANGGKEATARLLAFILILVCLLAPVNSYAQNKTFPQSIRLGAGIENTTAAWSKQAMQGFDLKVWMNNSLTLGKLAYDLGTPPPTCGNIGIGVEYPAGSCNEHLYGGGAWFGAVVNGQRVVKQMYIDGGTSDIIPERQDSLRNKFWRSSVYDTLTDPNRQGYYKRAMNKTGFDDDGDGLVDEDPVDGIDNDGDWNPLTDDIGADGIPDSLEVGCKGVYNPVTNPDPAFDDYNPARGDSCHPNGDGSIPRKNNNDLYTEKNGIADHGEPHVDEDGSTYSASDFYVTATDTFHYPANANPIGLQVAVKSYSWEQGTAAEAIDFLAYDFINVGKYEWQDVYLGWFGDADVGPVTQTQYPSDDYAAYDLDTRTAYVDNPVDSGSTPIGLTLIDATFPLDVLDHVFQWYDTGLHPGPGTADSVVYAWMTGDNLSGSHIAANQSPQSLSDTRFMVSCGSFNTVYPGEKLQLVYALVSGKNVDDMLNNARRAHDIYKFNYFIMPTVQVIDSGGTRGIAVVPDAPPVSPWGRVVSYQTYYGTQSGHYTDVVNSAVPAVIGRTIPGQIYYMRVRSVDEFGNLSALSDEVSNIPNAPVQVSAVNGEISVDLHWTSNSGITVAGYNVYRRASDQNLFTKLNSSLVTGTEFVDTAVWGNKKYYYEITTIDADSHESAPSAIVQGYLLPPAVPGNFIFGPSKSFIRLLWDPNREGDLRGYNVYRVKSGDTVFVKLNASVLPDNRFTDATVLEGQIYTYYVEAIDTTDAVSPRASVTAHTAAMDQGILIVNAGTLALVDSSAAFYRSVFSGYKDTIFSAVNKISGTLNNTIENAGRYSAIFWMQDSFYAGSVFPTQYPVGLKEYLLGGGKMLVMGRQLPSKFPQLFYPFLSDIFGIDSLTANDSLFNFAGAGGAQGFPSVSLDQAKLTAGNGRLRFVDRLSGVRQSQVIYTYHTDPTDSTLEDLPVGVRAVDTSYKAYYLSFPLYDLDFNSARSLIVKMLDDFGIVTGVEDKQQDVPLAYRLYQAYPNPFNPTTTIRFDVPAAGDVSLKIYDILGREIAVLVNDRKQPGHYETAWNAASYASGVYFYRLSANGFVETKKLLLMK
jgi:hypothetical protein